jgi:hypothetical protein
MKQLVKQEMTDCHCQQIVVMYALLLRSIRRWLNPTKQCMNRIIHRRCQMKVKVTFEDIIEAEDLQHAYTVVTGYCNHVANFEDVTAFNFEPLPDED